jgi:serine/threonine protein phosphatase PrpC
VRFLSKKNPSRGEHADDTSSAETVGSDGSGSGESVESPRQDEVSEHVLAPSDNRRPDEMNTSAVSHDGLALAEPDPEAAPLVDTPAAKHVPAPAIQAPVVLLGNPRLGSNPAALPRLWGTAPDSVLDGAQFLGLTVRAASLRGDDHRYAGETRQDSIGLWALDASVSLGQDQLVLLACVADGVGEHKLSHLGSARACSLLRQAVEAHIAGLLGQDRHLVASACERVIAEVASGLRVFASDSRLEPKEVSTTLSACLVIPQPQNGEGSAACAILFAVGDSGGFLLREGTWIGIPAPTADDGGVLSTKTDALPTRPDNCQVSTHALYAGDMLMLCTDGLGRPLERVAAVGEQLASWWGGRVPALPEFYWQLSFRAQTYGDDRSAVCIWLDGRS